MIKMFKDKINRLRKAKNILKLLRAAALLNEGDTSHGIGPGENPTKEAIAEIREHLFAVIGTSSEELFDLERKIRKTTYEHKCTLQKEKEARIREMNRILSDYFPIIEEGED
jgi:hypothetical protein